MANLLSDYLQRRGTSQEEFAEKIKAHQTQVSRYVTGARKPARRVREAIAKATRNQVPVSSWDTPRRRRTDLQPSPV